MRDTRPRWSSASSTGIARCPSSSRPTSLSIAPAGHTDGHSGTVSASRSRLLRPIRASSRAADVAIRSMYVGSTAGSASTASSISPSSDITPGATSFGMPPTFLSTRPHASSAIQAIVARRGGDLGHEGVGVAGTRGIRPPRPGLRGAACRPSARWRGAGRRAPRAARRSTRSVRGCPRPFSLRPPHSAHHSDCASRMPP